MKQPLISTAKVNRSGITLVDRSMNPRDDGGRGCPRQGDYWKSPQARWAGKGPSVAWGRQLLKELAVYFSHMIAAAMVRTGRYK